MTVSPKRAPRSLIPAPAVEVALAPSVWVVTHETSEYCPAVQLVAVRLTEAEAHAFVADVVSRYDALLDEVGPEPHVDGVDEEECYVWHVWWDRVKAATDADPLIGLVRDERDGFSVREMTL